jgi:hypothetical protein
MNRQTNGKIDKANGQMNRQGGTQTDRQYYAQTRGHLNTWKIVIQTYKKVDRQITRGKMDYKTNRSTEKCTDK